MASGLISFTIDIYNPDQFCSGRTIFVVIAGPAGPFMSNMCGPAGQFMSNICGPAGPFMHPDQIFCYRSLRYKLLRNYKLMTMQLVANYINSTVYCIKLTFISRI